MDRTNRRLSAQGLVGSDLDSPVDVVDRILAVQAQDPRGARLAIRSRLDPGAGEPNASAVDDALNDGSLVTGWLNRGTLHLVRSEDYRWLHQLTGIRLETSNLTRLKQEGVSPAQAEKGVKLIGKLLADGPATRPAIKQLLESKDVPVAGQALVHILFRSSILGLTVRGPMIGKEQSFVLVDDWLDPEPEIQREAALERLARRYLVGHGPANDRDLAKWAGIPVGQARRGLKAIAEELDELEDGLVDLKGRKDPKEAKAGAVKLLGSFDPILHGWLTRDWLLPDDSERQVVTTNGIFRPTILIGDRIAGTWTLAGGKTEFRPFGKLKPKEQSGAEADSEAVVRYLES